MNGTAAIQKLKAMKAQMSYFEMSKVLDMPTGTIRRWIRTGRINRLYAQRINEKLA